MAEYAEIDIECLVLSDTSSSRSLIFIIMYYVELPPGSYKLILNMIYKPNNVCHYRRGGKTNY